MKLGDELSRLVLRMSDLSGSNVVSGFEEYLTGYPLESANMYAFAKTWYADEMPRPGCVWTHTLLIPGSCMAEIPDLRALTALFVRPQASNSSKGFSQPIEFNVEEAESNISAASNDLTVQIADVIETLYVQNKDNVLIAAHNSRAYETALVRVWSQQWPQLRKAFTFCTGALSARGFGSKPFDVQCTHPSLVREITSATAAKQSQELSMLTKRNQQRPSWSNRAVEDASKPEGGQFRRLLWEFADSPDKKSFRRFAELVDDFLDPAECNVSELLGVVAQQFPSATESAGLKSALFGGKHDIAGLKPDDTWIILDPIVPHLSWIRDWDKCERLRRGLIAAFLKYRWPLLKLADCVKKEAVLSRVIESAKDVDGGSELVSKRF